MVAAKDLKPPQDKRIGTTLTELTLELGLPRKEAEQTIEELEADGCIKWAGFERGGEPVFLVTDKGRDEIQGIN